MVVGRESVAHEAALDAVLGHIAEVLGRLAHEAGARGPWAHSGVDEEAEVAGGLTVIGTGFGKCFTTRRHFPLMLAPLLEGQDVEVRSFWVP